VSYFQADEKQKLEVLALIAKVVGFNEEDRIKTGLDKPGYGMKYLRNMLPSRGATDAPLDLSIAEAFVKFLETESTPKTPIRLPASEVVLPVFISQTKNHHLFLHSRWQKRPHAAPDRAPCQVLPLTWLMVRSITAGPQTLWLWQPILPLLRYPYFTKMIPLSCRN
jgi:hypothetical protein